MNLTSYDSLEIPEYRTVHDHIIGKTWMYEHICEFLDDIKVLVGLLEKLPSFEEFLNILGVRAMRIQAKPYCLLWPATRKPGYKTEHRGHVYP